MRKASTVSAKVWQALVIGYQRQVGVAAYSIWVCIFFTVAGQEGLSTGYDSQV